MHGRFSNALRLRGDSFAQGALKPGIAPDVFTLVILDPDLYTSIELGGWSRLLRDSSVSSQKYVIRFLICLTRIVYDLYRALPIYLSIISVGQSVCDIHVGIGSGYNPTLE